MIVSQFVPNVLIELIVRIIRFLPLLTFRQSVTADLRKNGILLQKKEKKDNTA